MALEEERNKGTEAREVTGPGHPRVQTPPFIFSREPSYQLVISYAQKRMRRLNHFSPRPHCDSIATGLAGHIGRFDLSRTRQLRNSATPLIMS